MTLHPTSAPAVAPATTPAVAPNRTARYAGLGGLLAFTAWLLQPLLVLVLSGGEDRLTYASLEAIRWSAPYEVATFGLVALGLFLLVHGVREQCLAHGEPGPLAVAGHLLGYAGAFAWLVVAAGLAAPFTSASSDLETLPVADQTAALAIYGVVQMGTLVLAPLCLAGWAAMVGTHARRRGVVGRATAGVALLAGAAMLAPFAMPFAPPWGTLAIFVLALWLGVQQLGTARTGSRGA